MKQGTYSRARRLGSAMGRVAQGSPRENPADVFEYAVGLAVTRRLIRAGNVANAHAFADAFLVAWLRARDRRDQAKRVRRGLLDIAASDVMVGTLDPRVLPTRGVMRFLVETVAR